jgi:hypothetical protein
MSQTEPCCRVWHLPIVVQPIRPGLRDVTLSYRVASDADEETLQEILDTARSLSPVFDTITKPVAVAATLQKES